MPSVDMLGAALVRLLPTLPPLPVGDDEGVGPRATGKGVSMPIAKAPSFSRRVSAERLGGAFYYKNLDTIYMEWSGLNGYSGGVGDNLQCLGQSSFAHVFLAH